VQADAEGLTLAEAAARLGVSTDTVRRRIKRGDLSARQIDSKFGPAWVVLLPPASSLADGSHGAAPGPAEGVHGDAPAPVPGVVALVALVRDLQAELLRRTEAATAWQLRAEHLAGEVQHLRLALEAPKVAPESTLDGEPDSRPSTGLWARLAGWLGG
jgi:excisionase family DNA binding protein